MLVCRLFEGWGGLAGGVIGSSPLHCFTNPFGSLIVVMPLWSLMSNYRQGAFRNPFEQRLFETVRDSLAWCTSYATNEGFPHSVKGAAYHNVQTAEFHGELSTTDTFADPQSREIDVLLELELPKTIRLLTSGKDSEHRQKLEHVGDYEGLLASLRSNDKGWLYWAMIVARKGFQSGCEETAKRADIALVPPITGSVEWLSVLTEEEVLDRVADAVKIFTLGDAWRCDSSSYRTGVVYNSIYVGTREPSALPGTKRKCPCSMVQNRAAT